MARRLGRLSYLFVFILFLTPNGLLAQVNPTTPGQLVTDPPTLQNLGFAWYITGDDNRNAKVKVEFRKLGTSAWLRALDMLRVENRAIPDLIQGVTVSPGNLLAGSIFDLVPDTTYEVRLSLTDPDGGQAQQIVQAKTRPEPKYGTGGRTLYVIPGTGGGSGSQSDPFRGLTAADANARPGDFFILKPGTYARVTLTKDGTQDQPIVYQGEQRSSVIIDGAGTTAALIMMQNTSAGVTHGRKNIFIENMTLRNGSTGILGANSEGLVIRNNNIQISRISGDPMGITLGQDSKNSYICDNTMQGPETPFERDNDSYAVLLSGSGHVLCHNLIRDFWDAGGIAAGGNDVTDISIDFLNNIALNNTDDCFETDRSRRNIRVMRNICANSTNGISAQPVFGGPVYMMFNQIFNVANSAFKLNVGPSGVMIFHNSGTSAGQAIDNGESYNSTFRNNLFYGAEIRYAFETVSYRVVGQDFIFDYNGWSPRRTTNNYKLNNVRYDTLNAACDTPSNTTDFCAQTGNERHGILISRTGDWTNVPEPVWSGQPLTPSQWNFGLKSTSAAVNSGLALPNVNDGFSGSGPDRGALELGRPLPIYGPRTTINNRPILTTIADSSITEGQPISFNVNATDPDNEHVALAMASIPMGASFTDLADNHGVFSWTPQVGQAGIYPLRFIGTDASGDSGDITVNLEVKSNMTPPPTPTPSPNASVIRPPVVKLTTKKTRRGSIAYLKIFVAVSDNDGVAKVTGHLPGKTISFKKSVGADIFESSWRIPKKVKSSYPISITATDSLGNITVRDDLIISLTSRLRKKILRIQQLKR